MGVLCVTGQKNVDIYMKASVYREDEMLQQKWIKYTINHNEEIVNISDE